MRVAVDTGGTFTDVILFDAGQIVAHKRLSTPDDPARAVLEGIAAVAGEGRPDVIHGSTVATNALLEGKGGRAAFVTTAGFEDTLHIGRQNRPQLYALSPQRPAPPIPRDRCLGVRERVLADGSVQTALTDGEIARAVAAVGALSIDAVAVSLLHSYANPDHERRIGDALRAALPNVHVTLSSVLLPEFREYERGATCAVNAVVAPRMGDYLGRLEAAVGADRLRIMVSSGGSSTAAEARRAPVHTVLSGPAGGVVGALAVSGADKIVTFDMGGTSTDVALCDGAPTMTTEGAVGPLPVRVPLIDIHTVGAGGGSIAWVDSGGALRAGPQSAGAAPGPACYGRQSGPPIATVTDAHVVLGRLRPECFLGGQMALDVDAARAAVGDVAAKLGLSIEDTALGILRVAEATMARAIKVTSVERGHDVRDFALACFGGAGGLHACQLAVDLGMRRVIVPVHPGLLSALGMLFAPSVHNLSQSVLCRITADTDPLVLPHVQAAFEALHQNARDRLSSEGFAPDRQRLTASLDVRYAGQSHELTLPAEGDVPAAFEAEHRRLYGTASPGRDIELVTARLRAEGAVDPPALPRLEPRSGPQAARHTIEAFFSDNLEPGHRLDRPDLCAGDAFTGPLIVTGYSSTVVVPGGWSLTVDPLGNLILEASHAT